MNGNISFYSKIRWEDDRIVDNYAEKWFIEAMKNIYTKMRSCNDFLNNNVFVIVVVDGHHSIVVVLHIDHRIDHHIDHHKHHCSQRIVRMLELGHNVQHV